MIGGGVDGGEVTRDGVEVVDEMIHVLFEEM